MFIYFSISKINNKKTYFSLLVGQGAYEFATSNNILTVDSMDLISGININNLFNIVCLIHLKYFLDKAKKDFVRNKYKVMNFKHNSCKVILFSSIHMYF